jgi:hypothetical protein
VSTAFRAAESVRALSATCLRAVIDVMPGTPTDQGAMSENAVQVRREELVAGKRCSRPVNTRVGGRATWSSL